MVEQAIREGPSPAREQSPLEGAFESRERIAREALALVDEAGLGRLSMRRLGERLGVEAMSLYNYVESKADLLDAMHEHLLGQLAWDERGSWQTRVRSAARAFRDLMRAHPQAIPLLATHSARSQGALRLYDAAVAALQTGGLEPLESVRAFQAIFAMVVGHTIFYYGPGGLRTETRPDYESYPALGRFRKWDDYSPEDEFEFALDVFLRGLPRGRNDCEGSSRLQSGHGENSSL